MRFDLSVYQKKEKEKVKRFDLSIHTIIYVYKNTLI